jgi:hypothetical protein
MTVEKILPLFICVKEGTNKLAFNCVMYIFFIKCVVTADMYHASRSLSVNMYNGSRMICAIPASSHISGHVPH